MAQTDWVMARRRLEDLAAATGVGDANAFALEPVLQPHELAEVEAQIKVGLPEDYQEFLLTVGRGGAGPNGGLAPLRRVDGRWDWIIPSDPGMTDLARLHEPFPAAHPNAAALNALEDSRPLEQDFEDISKFERLNDDWQTRFAESFMDPARTVGAICISNAGCGSYVWIVVSGPERGTMWHDARIEDHDLFPYGSDAQSRAAGVDDGNRESFAVWYLAWLDKIEAEIDAKAKRSTEVEANDPSWYLSWYEES